MIREREGRLEHQGPLASVSVATTAYKRRDVTRVEESKRLEGASDRVWSMGVVNQCDSLSSRHIWSPFG